MFYRAVVNGRRVCTPRIFREAPFAWTISITSQPAFCTLVAGFRDALSHASWSAMLLRTGLEMHSFVPIEGITTLGQVWITTVEFNLGIRCLV